ncbi:hypothetical protein HHI36_003069 [Cryptolaemus montrouzieri]|uniref:Protein kinase domain-containing protein n=1 Tax=Cryptolaemus montrouzieri TaxID=559131 RepID=A0ABD2PDB7_9CUCU
MPSSVSNVPKQPPAPPPIANSVNESAKDKKPTVLECHGYFLGKTIGTGSYATVRVAHSNKHDGDVAIKIVSKFSAPADYLKKFLPREIEVVKGLRHPNLIRFLQAIETTHRVYIIMEYAENGSLLDIIRRDSSIDEYRARKWFRQLVDAVDYCHERGVVHRDIKCENMLMDNEFNIKLSDFGFARGHLKPRNGQVPLSDTFCGSYAYASPEILRGIPYQPQQADIWSMGVVLFAMVFGRLPFDDSNYRELIKQVSNKVIFPKEPRVSPVCKTLINKILSPAKSRVRISGIRNDQWFSHVSVPASVNKEPSSVDESSGNQNIKLLTSEEVGTIAANLLTKEQLEKMAKKSTRSTDSDSLAKGVVKHTDQGGK